MNTLFPSDDSAFDQFEDRVVPKQSSSSLRPWEKIKIELKEMIDHVNFIQWIEPLKVKSEGQNEIVISVPDIVFYQKILDDYLDKFDYCKSRIGLDLLFRFEIEEPNSEEADLRNDFACNTPADPDLSTPPKPNSEQQTFSRALSHHSHLNPEYRFDNFVNGPSNQFAHASCLAVADDPGQNYNPLFLYGSTGLGKTHLLHAVGNSVLGTRSNVGVTYISSERFMNEMIYCLRFNKMWDFRRKYRNCDLLLVDDIQFISGKERTQEEFFHTFNSLYEAKKQIIVTSDIFPQDIPDIEDRLRNRFQWGLIADIQPPDVEHRVAILMNKAEKQGVHLTAEAAQYIANHAKGSVRVLEGALRRVSAFAALQGRPLDISLATEVLQNVLGERKQQLTIDAIQKTVADHFKLRVSDLKSKKRQRAFSVPRQIAMYLARIRTNSSFPEIGVKFGGKDHTTVMHAVRKVEMTKKKDLEMRTNLETLDRKLDLLN